MDGIANHFPTQGVLDCRISRNLHNLKKFSGGNTSPGPRRSAPGAWTQRPISACLASVPIVPVLRNDHCLLCQNTEGDPTGNVSRRKSFTSFI